MPLTLLIYIPVFGLLWFVFIRPQQQRTRAAAALRASLEAGDEVILDSGIHGFLTEVEDDVVWIEVAEGTELKVSKSSVAAKVPIEIEESAAD